MCSEIADLSELSGADLIATPCRKLFSDFMSWQQDYMENLVRLCHPDRNNVSVNIRQYSVSLGEVGKLWTLAGHIYLSALMKGL